MAERSARRGSSGRSAHAEGSRVWVAAETLVAVALSLVATWPSVRYLTTRLYKGLYSIDANGGIWWPHAFVRSLLRGEYPFHARSLVWPEGQDVTLLIWNYGVALLFSPIYLLADPILAANLVALGIVVLNGLASAWAARVLTGSRSAGWAALVVGATVPFAWIEAGSGRQDQALWAPMALYLGAMLPLLEGRKERKWVVVSAAALAAAGAVYWFYAYFLILWTLAAVGIQWVRGRIERELLVRLAAVAAGALVLMLPFLVPVVIAYLRSPHVFEHIAGHVAHPLLLQAEFSLSPTSFVGIFGPGRHDGNLHVSALLLPVALWAAVKGRSGVRACALTALGAAVLACGPFMVGPDGVPVTVGGNWLALPMSALNLLPGFQRFWWPYRWMALAIPAMAVCVGWVVDRFQRRMAATLVLAVFLVVESLWILRLNPGVEGSLWPDQRVPAVFSEIAELPWPAPILHVPLGRAALRETVWQAFHHQPIDTGLDWHLPGQVPDTFLTRREQVPLIAALEGGVSRGGGAGRRTWTREEAGGFHYVLLSLLEDSSQTWRSTLEALLGTPDYVDCMVAVWHVPGVGKPLHTRGDPENCGDFAPEKGLPRELVPFRDPADTR